MLYCVVVFLSDCTFDFFFFFFPLNELLIHQKKKTAFLHGCSCSLCYFENGTFKIEKLDLCIHDLEGGQKYLFRRLIETRVSIL